MAPNEPHLLFEDPRFRMTFAGRMFTRVGGILGYITFLAATVVFILSSSLALRWLGVFFGLILIDRFLHRHKGDVSIPELMRRKEANVVQAVSPKLIPLLERAFEVSELSKTNIDLELGRSLLKTKEIEAGLKRLDIDPKEMAAKLEEFLKRPEAIVEQTSQERLAAFGKLLCAAFEVAADNGHNFIAATDIFSTLSNSDLIVRLFTIFGVDRGDLERAFIFTTAHEHQNFLGRLPSHISSIVLPAQRGKRHRIINRAWTSRPTPTLDSYSTDFSDAAREQEIGFMIGHEAEYQHMANILARPAKPNALLVGEEGSGAIVLFAHLAFKIEKDAVPPALFDHRLVSLDIGRLISGGSPEELQARLQKIVEEIMVAGNVILVIPDIHNLLRTSGDAYLSAADALMPVIRSNAFPIIGTTFPHEYREMIEPRSDFVGIFETVLINEISAEEAEEILVYQSLVLEQQTNVTITFGAIKMAVKLGKKYFQSVLLPRSAVDLLKSAVTTAAANREKVVDHESIIRVAETRINIPLHETSAEENQKLLKLESTIHKRIIGQEEAVKAVSDSLREYRSGLARKGGPIASFLFVGPTGVGKTELAKAISNIQFGSEAAMSRFDMTEYKEVSSIERFIGSSDGSIPGALIEEVKRKPYGLVLLDEFEKAAPEILDLFLQVLDDGRLTDGTGHTFSFDNMIIIATSNAHSDIINDSLRKGESVASVADYLKTRLTDVFKPELINRFSRVVVFHDLQMPDMQKIAVLELKKLSVSIEEKGLSLQMGDDAVQEIAKLGYDPIFGARPLRRAIDEHIRAPLAEWLLANNPPHGSEIKVTLKGDLFTFSL